MKKVTIKILSFFKSHLWVFALALFVGGCAVAPSILAPRALGDTYQGIQFLYLNDETIYRSRIHEILDGHPGVASPFLYEYKEAVSVVPPINEYFYAVPAKLFGLSGAIVFAKFFFPALLFLLVYLLVFQLLSSLQKETALFTALTVGLVVSLGFDFVDLPLLRGLFFGPPETHLLIWTRLVNPVVGVLILFATLILLWRVFLGKAGKSSILLAIPLSISVGYFFSFAVCFTFTGLLMGVSLIRKEYKTAMALGLAVLLSVVIDYSYWYHMFTMLGGEAGRVASLKNGMYFSHHILVNKLVLATTLMVGMLFGYGYIRDKLGITKFHRTWIFVGALLATSWIVYAQQGITGKTVWPAHFVQFTVPMMMVSVFVAGALVLSQRFPKLWSLFLSVVVLVSMTYGAYSASTYRHSLNDFSRQQQNYGSLITWLNTHAPGECVVLSRGWNEELERIIPGYTNCNVYNTQYVYSVIPRERVLHNFLVRMRLEEVDPSNVEEYLYKNENDVRGYFFDNWDQLYMRTQGRDVWLKGKVDEIALAYRSAQGEDLGKSLREFRLDYIYANSPFSEQMLSQIGNISLATSTDRFLLYQIR